MRVFDRILFGDTRAWVCQQATGDTLEVAVGTGLNLGFYPSGCWSWPPSHWAASTCAAAHYS